MSQGLFTVPTGGSEAATTFAGQCNTAWLAVASKHSGSSAPVNGPGLVPVQFQDWIDTTNASFPVHKIYDGANWPRRGTLDIANSVYCPQLGGGLSTIASAATCDIGSKPGTLVTISGTATITSFGTSAALGEEKRVYCGGQFQITNSANIVCPGAQNIITTAGDIFTAIYDGVGVWLIYGYQKSSAGIGIGLQSGTEFFMYGTGTIAGAARANGNTIGNTGSGATEGTGPAYLSLYTKIWNESAGDSEVVISGGRGANAAADWAALKTITLPDMRGRVPFGLDISGAVAGAAGRVTGTTASPDGNTCGAVAGAQVVTLTTATMPVHAHTASSSSISSSFSSDGGHTHNVTLNFAGNASGGGSTFYINNASLATGIGFASISTSTSTSTSTTVNNSGSGGAHLNMQPSKGGTWYIVL